MVPKSVSTNPFAPMRCLAVIFVMILYPSIRKGQCAPSSSVRRRVYNGTNADEGRFPYMCSIRELGSGRHICGGTLIDSQWVMTAAHCLDPDSSDSAGMSPLLYCNISRRTDEDESKRFTTSRCYLHHLWDGETTNGTDIALCQLEQSASVPIPDLSGIGDDFTTDDVFSVLGWGATSVSEDYAEVLQIGSGLRFMQRSMCNETDEFRSPITESMMCTERTSSDACRGDSGGPLFIPHDLPRGRDADPVLDLIVGITSFGAEDCGEDLPSVYTRISCYRPWIDCIMQGTEQDCSVHEPCEENA